MKKVRYIIFRYLTHADFFNIYKPEGTEPGGGGQTYIDIKTGSVPLEFWHKFFQNASEVQENAAANGPEWTFTIKSIGLPASQRLKIYQRRPQTIAISSQRINSSRSNRVYAWHPENGFPEPDDPSDRTSCPPKLAIYIIRTEENDFYAGWFQDSIPCKDGASSRLLNVMLPSLLREGHAGVIDLSGENLYIDENDADKPFTVRGYNITQLDEVVKSGSAETYKPKTGATGGALVKGRDKEISSESKRRAVVQRKPKAEDELTASLFEEDEDYDSSKKSEYRESIQRVRTRNARAVRELKELYRGRCQISGCKFSFNKKDGSPYSEAHHLIPLSEEGADSPYNIIIVNPLIHRMLHYAEISPINFADITQENTLEIIINGEKYTITWHPDHADYVRKNS